MTTDTTAPAATPETLATRLHGSEYDTTWPPKELMDEAKAAGLVVISGASDDLMELDGALHDETGAGERTTHRIDAEGLIECPDARLDQPVDHPAILRYIGRYRGAATITAVWDAEGYSWVYETDIPHATFDVVEDGEKYCRGIVFRLSDLPSVPTGERA